MKKTILIVDDTDAVRDIVSFMLEREGYSVIGAVNGKDALEKLKGAKIGMVITDLLMPIMDGMEFIEHLRSSDTHKSTPVVMLTSEPMGTRTNECRRVGIAEWIVKPFMPDVLINTVRKLI